MLRGQAELISTVIIVSIAVTLALGLVYYLTPLVAQARLQQQVYAQLAGIASGLTTSLSAYENDSGTLEAVISVTNNGFQNVRLYYGVLGFDDQGVPRSLPVYSIYNMTGSVATLPVGGSGWSPLPGFNVTTDYVYVYVKDGYYQLWSLGLRGNYTLYDGGIVKPGDSRVIGFEVTGAPPGYRYAAVIYAEVSGYFYSVAVIPFG